MAGLIYGSCESQQLLPRTSRPVIPDQRISSTFRQHLVRARWVARILGTLHTLHADIAVFNLVWACVFLLGAHINSLHATTYCVIVTLIFLEASRFSYSSFFTQLLTRLPSSSTNCSSPKAEQDHGRSCIILHRLPLCIILVQLLLIAPSFSFPLRLSVSGIHNLTADNVNHDDLSISLRIFWILAMVSAVISTAIIVLASSFRIYFQRRSEGSVFVYYDKVVRDTLNEGMVTDDSFSFSRFAVGLLAREYASRCKRWERVAAEHRDLIRYLYGDKQAVESVEACLRSQDAAMRQAAAKMVGTWAEEVGQEVQLPANLLTSLADMVGIGEVGWAAVSSFGALASNNPRFVLNTLTSNKQPVLQRIVQLVVDSGQTTRSLASVPALHALTMFIDVRISSRNRS